MIVEGEHMHTPYWLGYEYPFCIECYICHDEHTLKKLRWEKSTRKIEN